MSVLSANAIKQTIMTTIKSIQIVLLIIFLFGCSQADRKMERKEGNAAEDSTANGFISSSGAVAGKDSSRKFIRTADMKFKVKSVVKATTAIEDVTKQFEGFVTYTNLKSNIDYTTTIAVSADSSLETTYFTVSNSLILRVPNTKLDTTLRSIAVLIDYLDYRIIKADDVKLQLLENQMTQNRVSRHEQRLTKAIDTKGKKLNETTNAEENLLNKQEQADDSKIANLSLQDRIAFSTINLTIYQRQAIKRDLISNNKNIEEYEPGFGAKFLNALKEGWDAFEALIVFLARLWALILLGILTIILWKKFGRRLSKK
jgi:hypothetical protein